MTVIADLKSCNMKNILVLLFLLIGFSGICQITTMSNLKEVNTNSKKWSSLFLKGQKAAMFDDMKKYWPIPEEKIDDMKNKTLQFKDMITQSYGNPVDVIKISDENLSNAAYRESYYLRYERSALRTIFIYYNNGTGWVLSSFEWDDKFTEEFKK